MAEEIQDTRPRDTSSVKQLADNLLGYVDTKLELFKLDLQLKARDLIVNTLHAGTLAVTGLFTLLFLMITLGLALNDLFDSSWLGFAVVTALFAIPFLIAVTNKDKSFFRKIADGMLNDSGKSDTK